MKTAAKYSALLIGIYLGVYYYTGAGTLVTDGFTGASSLVSTFQGNPVSKSSSAAGQNK